MSSPWLFSWLLASLNYRKAFLQSSLLFVPCCSPPFVTASVSVISSAYKNKPGMSSSGLWLLLDKIVSMFDK